MDRMNLKRRTNQGLLLWDRPGAYQSGGEEDGKMIIQCMSECTLVKI